MSQNASDHRFMAAAIRFARRHEGLTGTNPSVACVLVRDDGDGPKIIGAAVTAKGGRPHAEPTALTEAGNKARGATAYATLEPCAHHGKTPPCAQTLINAGVARVVAAVVDPDDRVNQKGLGMLREAGVQVDTAIATRDAEQGLAAYLTQRRKNRAHVTLKQAISPGGFIGAKGGGIIPITDKTARAQSHLLRARHHAILAGVGTVIEDDPDLTCRLPGLEHRSPIRIIIDPKGRTPLSSKLVRSARNHRTIIVLGESADNSKRESFFNAGCQLQPCELDEEGHIALPELLEDFSAIGIHSILVEGGAVTARTFLQEKLVDEIIIFEGAGCVDDKRLEMVASPVTESILNDWEQGASFVLGPDRMTIYRPK